MRRGVWRTAEKWTLPRSISGHQIDWLPLAVDPLVICLCGSVGFAFWLLRHSGFTPSGQGAIHLVQSQINDLYLAGKCVRWDMGGQTRTDWWIDKQKILKVGQKKNQHKTRKCVLFIECWNKQKILICFLFPLLMASRPSTNPGWLVNLDSTSPGLTDWRPRELGEGPRLIMENPGAEGSQFTLSTSDGLSTIHEPGMVSKHSVPVTRHRRTHGLAAEGVGRRLETDYGESGSGRKSVLFTLSTKSKTKARRVETDYGESGSGRKSVHTFGQSDVVLAAPEFSAQLARVTPDHQVGQIGSPGRK